MSSKSKTGKEQTKYQPPDRWYWANEEHDRIGSAVRHHFVQYHERLEFTGQKTIWRRAFLAHHGRNPDGGYANAHTITFGGEDGETSQIHMGHFRRHVKGRKQMATGQRPAFEVTSRTNDPQALSAIKVAKQVFEHDLDETGLEEDLREVHERAVLYAEGYYVQTWDPRIGPLAAVAPVSPLAVTPGEPGIPELDVARAGDNPIVMKEVHEGDIRGLVRSPIDVAHDLTRDKVSDSPWFIVRDRVHKWELARHYPESTEARKKILSAPSAESSEYQLFDGHDYHDGDSDYIERLTLYHLPTNAVPKGRVVEVIGEYALPGTDTIYRYDHCVVHQDVPSPEHDRAVGYCDNWDLLGPTQALDAIETTILSLSDAGSLVNWVAPKGAGVKVQDLKGRLQLVEYDDEEGRYSSPTVMERPKPEESDFKASEHYMSHMRVLSGQNAVVQGDPESNIKSGNFAALVASMAVTAANDEVASYAALMRSVMNGRLALYKQNLSAERTIDIAGKDNESHVLVFKSDTLAGAARVKIEVGSPMSRTIQGKLELAQQLFQMYGPQQVSMSQYLALMETGRLDDIEPTAAEEDKIGARTENDLFVSGQGDMVIAVKTDHHACHIREHRKQLNDPAFRYEPNPDGSRIESLMALAAHIDAHESLWQQMSQMQPGILLATSQDPPPPSMAAMMGGGGPPGAEGAPPPDGPPGGSVALPPGGGNPAAGDPAMPAGTPDNIALPNPAKNPMNPDQPPVEGMRMPNAPGAQG